VIRALAALARARLQSHRARLVYRAGAGATTNREVDVLGLGFQDGRWYALVHCHLRRAVRLLRVDRIASARPSPRRARAAAPHRFDPGFFASVEYLEPGAPVAHLVSVQLDRRLAAAATVLFPTAIVERHGRAAVCHVRASRPAILAALVESLGREARLLTTYDDGDRATASARDRAPRVH
jgi:predicted DNA-binding transcriptional regulator YafY